VTPDLTALSRAGDGDAFRQLVRPYQHELQVHCYRILGSAQDAEDAVQETLLAAWQGLPTFEERSSLRTWLYRIATNRCLNILRSASRRPTTMDTPQTWANPPEPSRISEVTWLEPFPDLVLERIPDSRPGPEARYEKSEAISLAFITALQLLPPRQRAVLVLRDVLGFRAAEVAAMLETTVDSVNSALTRARATLRGHPVAGDHEPPPAPGSPVEAELVRRLTEAYQTADLDGIIALLTEDVWLTMPPVPFEYQGREVAARALRLLFGTGRTYRLIATRANGQPAFGLYVQDPHSDVLHANGIMVITLAGDRIRAMTRFDNSSLARFGLPRTLRT
jgi:RNA polymerase sigma-70 factor (TIGR02960 family)